MNWCQYLRGTWTILLIGGGFRLAFKDFAAGFRWWLRGWDR